MRAALFESLRSEVLRKRRVVLLTELPSGDQHLVNPDGELPEGLAPPLFETARQAASRDESTLLELDGKTWFANPFNPPLRLVVVGAVHIAQPLAHMAAATGFAVVVVDPRSAFATEDRFPGVERSTAWPDRALSELAPDRRTAVVTLTHDPKLDDPALHSALLSEAFYIGCLGSGKTHAARLERLKRRGMTEAQLSRLRGPVGLRIGARSPAEIAVSILAQIVEQLRLGATA